MRAALLSFTLASAVALSCAHKTSGELAAQTGEEATSHTTREPEPRATSAPVAAAPEPGPSGLAPTPPPGGYVAARCPLRCFVAEGRTQREEPAEKQAELRAALGPTMDAVRQCAWNDWSDGYGEGRGWRVRVPILNLRFDGAKTLVDVGVDSNGAGPTADTCMQNIVRGGTSIPKLTHDGPAVVRCSERCDVRGKGKPEWVTPR